MVKKILFIFCLTTLQYAFSQDQKDILIFGIVKNINEKNIANAHIYNATSKQGTISNKDGAFHLKVKKGDWLQVTNLQYKTKRFRVTNTILKEKTIQVYLFEITNQLEEVKIKKKMKGFLSLDRKEQLKDTIGELMTKLIDGIKKIPFDDIMNMSIEKDEIHLQKPTVTPGILPGLKGIGGSMTMPDYASIRKKALRKKLNFKTNFPLKLKEELGEHFFFQKLKIPKEKYYHFLAYCNSLGIEQLYKENKILQLIQLLQKEAKSYLKNFTKD